MYSDSKIEGAKQLLLLLYDDIVMSSDFGVGCPHPTVSIHSSHVLLTFIQFSWRQQTTMPEHNLTHSYVYFDSYFY